MAENNISSSQETTCSLPLSQETCNLLMQLNQSPLTSIFNDVQLINSLQGLDMIQVPNHLLDASCNQPQPIRPPSALPASEIYPGEHSFEISFKCYENAKWVFSEKRRKLYVSKGTPVPINFSTNCFMPSGVTIRTMALFSCPGNASEVVTRCVNHSMNEIKAGIYEAEHLVRCESKMAVYFKDPYSGHHSVNVPFQNPAVGERSSPYIYKFSCWGSCSGGPNRRPLMLVFTLEIGGQVIGRQKIDVKICACPGRDSKLEDGLETKKASKKRPNPAEESGIVPETFPKKSSKKLKPETGKEKYIIKTYDRKCYKFLELAKMVYNVNPILKKNKPNPSDFKFIYSSSTSSEDDDSAKNN